MKTADPAIAILSAAPAAPAAEPAVTVIVPKPGWRLVDVPDLWRHRGVLVALVRRDVKVRYKQTALGAGWAVLQPLVTMLGFSVFLGRVAARPDGGVPYPLFAFAGLVPWLFLAGAVGKAAESVVNDQQLVTKVYFPRLLMPLSAVAVGAIDFAVALALLIMMTTAYGFVPGPSALVMVPLSALTLAATAVGLGAALSTLTVSYRDFRGLLPLMLQAGMFATPTVYLQGDLPFGPRGRALLPLNPAHGAVDNVRRALLGQPPDLPALAVSSAVAAALLLAGVLTFQRFERRFSDVI